MTDPLVSPPKTPTPRCAASVWIPGTVRSRGCDRKGKVQCDGVWYCGTHDPETRKARDVARLAKWDHERAVLQAQMRVIAARNEAADLIERGVMLSAQEMENARFAIVTARLQLAELQGVGGGAP